MPVSRGLLLIDAILREGSGNRPSHNVGPDNQKSLRFGLGHFQPARNGPCCGALHNNRGNDYKEGEWNKESGVRESRFFELHRKQRRYRGGDNAARCNPGQHVTFRPR